MSIQSHNLGFPRIGRKREIKKAVESYWKGNIGLAELTEIGQTIRRQQWQLQASLGLDYIPVGDFAWYDHVLNTSALLGVIPDRFQTCPEDINLDAYFCMARGQAPNGLDAVPCRMTKWFDTNYHYIVPEFQREQQFCIADESLFAEVEDAIRQGHSVKPVLLGPLSYLYLGKIAGGGDVLSLVTALTETYNGILRRLKAQGVEWVQIDEPILVLDLPDVWRQCYQRVYAALATVDIKLLLTTYFGDLNHHLDLICQLPTAGLHLDLCSTADSNNLLLSQYPQDRVLSLGLVNGRNIWINHLDDSIKQIEQIRRRFNDNIWIAPSCSLLHVPADLELEQALDPEIKQWLAFAKQKIVEVVTLTKAAQGDRDDVALVIEANNKAIQSRSTSPIVHNARVRERVEQLDETQERRHASYAERAPLQRASLQLPEFPTTTIGSFPQTAAIRCLRRDYRAGKLTTPDYHQGLRAEIAQVIAAQEALGLDVLVHGEAERNDMVEYFGELLAGFAFTEHAWVQSYGSRCVKPPIIYGDVERREPMTIDWIQYAQSQTSKPVKGMLTGPVTILAWSFPRDDQPQEETAVQIALALRDEVSDLERTGIKIIQIDEPAFREKLPLRQSQWQYYLDWAVRCFRLSSAVVADQTQIHTHMCYSEFNLIIDSIAALDADVITIESSRSDMHLLQAFEAFSYPNEIGPGVYDIHSPRIPSTAEIFSRIQQILAYIPAQRLWINPDCGLKTRQWDEVNQALKHMVVAAQLAREAAQRVDSVNNKEEDCLEA